MKSMDVTIDDANIAMTVLNGLSDKYKQLIVAVDTTQEKNLSLELVKSLLLQEQQRPSEHVGNIVSISVGRVYTSSQPKIFVPSKRKTLTQLLREK